MEFKKELNKLVDIVKAAYLKHGSKITNEEIAKRLGYNRSYFSTLTGATGKVEKEHIENFKAHFHSELNGVVKPAAPGDSINRERALIKVLLHQVATLTAEISVLKKEKEPISRERALLELRERTNLVIDDLEDF